MIATIIIITALTGCSTGTYNPTCNDNGDCEEMQACLDNTCTDVECLTSRHCTLNHFCDVEGRYTCEVGCHDEEDCMAGQTCNEVSNTCQAYGCRSTTLDCPVGTTCNTATGVCDDWSTPLCSQTCDVIDRPNCGAGQECQVVSVGDTCRQDRDCPESSCAGFLTSSDTCRNLADCPDDTQECTWMGQCVTYYCHVDYCMPTCNPAAEDACPAAFECIQTSTSSVCYGDCDFFQEHGYL